MDWVLILLLLVGLAVPVGIYVYSTMTQKKPNKPTGCEWTAMPGRDNDGVDPFSKRTGVTLEQCKKLCCDDKDCLSFQYREKDQRCLLKHGVGDINDAAPDKTLYVRKIE
jgi:hypothetical protein